MALALARVQDITGSLDSIHFMNGGELVSNRTRGILSDK